MKTLNRTIFFKNKPSIISTYSIVGPKEKNGQLGNVFDLALNDDRFGEETYEKAECKMLSTAVKNAIKKANLKEEDVGIFVGGDLLNQIISASFTARDFDIPFLGLYNACATITGQAQFFSIGKQSMQQRYRIGTAGKADDHRFGIG